MQKIKIIQTLLYYSKIVQYLPALKKKELIELLKVGITALKVKTGSFFQPYFKTPVCGAPFSYKKDLIQNCVPNRKEHSIFKRLIPMSPFFDKLEMQCNIVFLTEHYIAFYLTNSAL